MRQLCAQCTYAGAEFRWFFGSLRINPGYRRKDGDMEKLVDPSESKRTSLVSYAKIFGVEILPDEESLEASVNDLIGFLADIDTLDLEGNVPATIFDPSWPRVNETQP